MHCSLIILHSISFCIYASSFLYIPTFLPLLLCFSLSFSYQMGILVSFSSWFSYLCSKMHRGLFQLIVHRQPAFLQLACRLLLHPYPTCKRPNLHLQLHPVSITQLQSCRLFHFPLLLRPFQQDPLTLVPYLAPQEAPKVEFRFVPQPHISNHLGLQHPLQVQHLFQHSRMLLLFLILSFLFASLNVAVWQFHCISLFCNCCNFKQGQFICSGYLAPTLYHLLGNEMLFPCRHQSSLSARWDVKSPFT